LILLQDFLVSNVTEYFELQNVIEWVTIIPSNDNKQINYNEIKDTLKEEIE